MISSIKDLERRRALSAYQFITRKLEKIEEDENKKDKNSLRSYCVKLPTMILNNRLLETLLFFKSKKGIHLDIFEEWNSYIGQVEELEKDDLMIELINCEEDNNKISRISEEILSYSVWLKRTALAEIVDNEDDLE
ncbi:type III-B CRISPR module-associated protein Cmr5 [Halonatronum saccharophilum]|uniref:type III-B CRISPR module-associated protein Cmr5 n=1 Tax=Halonatronum saccharophilum TaxID=150060 RepID=UPI0004846A67|nr:type III-B CRISPR module-associated protein Cmr5 [Halonatronum saccharophilum]